jgi:hypothetical protein
VATLVKAQRAQLVSVNRLLVNKPELSSLPEVREVIFDVIESLWLLDKNSSPIVTGLYLEARSMRGFWGQAAVSEQLSCLLLRRPTLKQQWGAIADKVVRTPCDQLLSSSQFKTFEGMAVNPATYCIDSSRFREEITSILQSQVQGETCD